MRDLHGLDPIPWDHLRLPDRFWRDIKALPNGCWVAESRRKARGLQNTVVTRLCERSAYEALAITPTCGDQRCVNPAHLCVVWRNALSGEG